MLGHTAALREVGAFRFRVAMTYRGFPRGSLAFVGLVSGRVTGTCLLGCFVSFFCFG